MALQFGYVSYTDDSGTVGSIKMRSDVATALGLSISKLPGPNFIRRPGRGLRHVRAKGNTHGNYIRVPQVQLTSSLYAGGIGTTFTWTDSQSYTVESTAGERTGLSGQTITA